MRRAVILGAALALIADVALAQSVGASTRTPGVSLSEVQAIMPQPASTLPPMEVPAGSVGTPGTYRPADAAPIRITRATTVVTVTGGTFSGTWTTPLAAAPNIVLTPISAAASVDCQLTAAPTTTTFQGRCYTAQGTLLNLSIITAGLTVTPVANSAAGISVQVVAIPPTQ